MQYLAYRNLLILEMSRALDCGDCSGIRLLVSAGCAGMIERLPVGSSTTDSTSDGVKSVSVRRFDRLPLAGRSDGGSFADDRFIGHSLSAPAAPSVVG